MAEETNQLRVRLVTPERTLFEHAVIAVELPAKSGYMEVLYGAAPLVAELGAGDVIMHGGTLAVPLSAPRGFMPMLSRMVTVGESAGTLDEVLLEVAKFYESQLQGAIRSLSVIIEPLIIIVVGSIVGFVYISFFMALFAAGGATK